MEKKNKLRLIVFDTESGKPLMDIPSTAIVGGVVTEDDRLVASCFSAVRTDGEGVKAAVSAARKCSRELLRRTRLEVPCVFFAIRMFFEKLINGGNISYEDGKNESDK